MKGETGWRSLTKTITFRMIMVVAGFIIAYLFTRDIGMSLGISLVRDGFATLAYFFHERAWEKIQWGRKSEEKEKSGV